MKDGENKKDRAKKNLAVSKKSILLSLGGVILVILIFWLGIQVGNGNILTLYSENKNLSTTLNYARLQQEYSIIKQNFDGKLTNQQLQDGAMSGLASSTGDPYTEYFNASQATALTDQIDNVVTGIGVEVGENASNQIVVIAPISGTPAAKAGLQPGDQIISINGQSTQSMNVDNAANVIRGNAGTTVTLGIMRGGVPMTFKITREKLTIPSVQSSIINGNIGYIQIIDFSNDTGGLVQAAANNFKQKNVKGIILDLRDNPGGLVQAAVSVSSLWLPEGKTIMTEKHDGQVVQTLTATGGDVLNGIPTVVLINGGSASASEITSAALKDNGQAVLYGTQSFGKGSVQELEPLSDGALLKVTIAHWYTPDNVNINHVGITPDKIINQPANSSTDEQKNDAISYLESL